MWCWRPTQAFFSTCKRWELFILSIVAFLIFCCVFFLAERWESRPGTKSWRNDSLVAEWATCHFHPVHEGHASVASENLAHSTEDNINCGWCHWCHAVCVFCHWFFWNKVITNYTIIQAYFIKSVEMYRQTPGEKPSSESHFDGGGAGSWTKHCNGQRKGDLWPPEGTKSKIWWLWGAQGHFNSDTKRMAVFRRGFGWSVGYFFSIIMITIYSLQSLVRVTFRCCALILRKCCVVQDMTPVSFLWSGVFWRKVSSTE